MVFFGFLFNFFLWKIIQGSYHLLGFLSFREEFQRGVHRPRHSAEQNTRATPANPIDAANDVHASTRPPLHYTHTVMWVIERCTTCKS